MRAGVIYGHDDWDCVVTSCYTVRAEFNAYRDRHSNGAATCSHTHNIAGSGEGATAGAPLGLLISITKAS